MPPAVTDAVEKALASLERGIKAREPMAVPAKLLIDVLVKSCISLAFSVGGEPFLRLRGVRAAIVHPGMSAFPPSLRCGDLGRPGGSCQRCVCGLVRAGKWISVAPVVRKPGQQVVGAGEIEKILCELLQARQG